MALSLEQKRTIAELTGLGIITHQVADMLGRGALTKLETDAALKVLGKVGRTMGRGLVRAPGTVGLIAMRHPYLATAGVVYVAYKNRDEIDNLLDRGYEIMTDPGFGQPPQLGQREGFRPGPAMVTIPPKVTKRAVSTANKAVKQGMKWLKAGTKAATGAKPGKLPKGAFKTVVKAAGLANPKTKSRIGKGKTIMNKLARRLKKWW